MAYEFTNELNQDVLNNLLEKIKSEAAVGKAGARGEAVRRGLTGGSFEGTRVGAIERGAQQSAADTMIQLAVENATRQREERLIKEGQAYQTSERLGSQGFATSERLGGQEFTAGQNEAQRLWGTNERLAGQGWQSGENAQNRLFTSNEALMANEREKTLQKRQGRIELWGAGANMLGNIVGVGNIVGGGVAAKLFCFDPATLIEMADSGQIRIQNICLGDEIKGGGKVSSIRYSYTENGTRYNYKGIIVTGSHCVCEDGKWLRVKDSVNAKPISGSGVVFSLITEKHLIYSNGIKFDDELELAPNIPIDYEDKHIIYLNSQEAA